jgi:predicted thioesterase
LASAWGDEFPPAASTPFVLGLAETACHRAVSGYLDDGEITVGVSAQVFHDAPSPLGAELTAHARLDGCHGKRFTFRVDIVDRDRVVARVSHVRARVPAERITARLEDL